MTTFDKPAGDDLTYQVAWSAWLDDDTITSSSWSADTGITLGVEGNTSTNATVKISGGTDGEEYDVHNQIVTLAGDTATRTFSIRIAERRD